MRVRFLIGWENLQICLSFLKTSGQNLCRLTAATRRTAFNWVKLSCGTIPPLECRFGMWSDHARSFFVLDCILRIFLESSTVTSITRKVALKRIYGTIHNSFKSRNTADTDLILRIYLKLFELYHFSSFF